jgi:membrane protease YdiL (CAAX protease family)
MERGRVVINVFYSVPHGLWFALGIVVVITLLVLLEKWLARRIRKRGDFYPALLSFLVILSKIVIPLVLLWKVYGLDPDSLGWVKGGFFQAILKGVVLAAFMMAFIFIYQKYSHLLFHKPYTSTGGRFLTEGVSGTAMGIAVSAALMNAFGEEIIFRGMLLPALSGYLGVALAVVVQSLVFTAYHFFPLQNSVLLFVMGIFFALGYLWSGSLLTPVLPWLSSFVQCERGKNRMWCMNDLQ